MSAAMEDVVLTGTTPAIARTRAPTIVDLPDSTVFDLEAYAASYSGRRLIQRLLFIARSCPALALDAYAMAEVAIKASTVDVGLYQNAVAEYNNQLSLFSRERENNTPSTAANNANGRQALNSDDAWATTTRRSAAKELDKLEVELKNYQNNLIKESIRMGHRDLGNFHHSAGELQSAIRSHMKSRDYCTASSHIVEMCLAVIELALEMQNYAFVKNYVVKAEAALEVGGNAAALSSGTTSSGAPSKPRPVVLPGMVAPGQSKKEEAQEREKVIIQERLAVAEGLADLGQGSYNRAAIKFLRAVAGAKQEDVNHSISPGDLAIYVVLCGLATFDRPQMKRLMVENSELRPLLELEPHLKDLIAHFYESRYSRALEVLSRFHPRHALDIHLSPHLAPLIQRIRSRAIVQYFEPFGSVGLAKMSSAFGWTEDRTLGEVIQLIESGQLKARVDSKNKIIKAHQPSQRLALFNEAIESGQRIDNATRAVLLRIKLIQHDLVVKEKARGGARNGNYADEDDEVEA